MNPSDFRVRRATIEDLPALTALWQSMNLPVNGLDRRLTEFQVATDAAGKLVGAVGFQLVGKQGLIHSEGFTDFGMADTVRPMLWERLQMVATNHGTVRAWTKEIAPFWKQIGLAEPDAETLGKLPVFSANELPGKWLTLKLREDVEEVLSLDKEFELFKQSAEQQSQAAFNQAKMLKTIATIAAIILAIVVVAGSIYMMRNNFAPTPR
jgi:hypothetical protein